MTEDAYILALARALTRDEALVAAEARPLLLELALRIRALLLVGSGGILRRVVGLVRHADAVAVALVAVDAHVDVFLLDAGDLGLDGITAVLL